MGFKFTQKANLLGEKPACSSNQDMLELMTLQYCNDRQFLSFSIRGARVVECLILFTGFTDALWPLNLNISDDFKVHSKGVFNNYIHG